jgi:hypothetical protein
LINLKGRNGRATSGQSNKALHFRREIVPKVDTVPRWKAGVTTARNNETLQILDRKTVDEPPIFKGAKGTLRSTGTGQNRLELKQLYSFGLGMIRFRHSTRNESCLKFLNAKPIHILPVKENWEGESVSHKERKLRHAYVAKLTRTMLWVNLS